MKNKILQYLFLSCSVMVLFSACRKDPFKGKETLESGKTFVWIEQAPTNNQFFDVFTNVKNVQMFTIRRDAANKADLQKAVTITLKSLGDAYLNGTGYDDLFTTDIYTLPTDADIATGGSFTGSEGITKTNDGLTINFAAGEFAKNVFFKVDGSKIDLSKQYAVAFAITNFGGFTKKVGTDTLLSSVAVKNRWDGVYTMEGTLTDKKDATISDINTYLAGGGLTDYNIGPPMQYEFRTVSATTCTLYDNYFYGDYVFTFTSGDSYNLYGSFSPVFTFDPATNKITSITNYYGQPASNGRYATMDPTGVNAYDPTAKTVKAKWGLYGGLLVGPNEERTVFDYTFTYIGSR